MTAIDVSVLGELTATRDGTRLRISGPGRRALLALLAANVGRVVPLERILDGLWGEAAPASATKVVQTHVSQLRRLLEPDRHDHWQILRTHPSGYRLALDTASVDAARFEAAIAAAAELGDAEAVEALRAALASWRGRPYAGIDRPFAEVEAARLERLRDTALTRCLAGELARGRHQEVEPELRALLAEQPLDESLAELLMLALYRSGHQAEALRAHAELRARLADELGADPGPSIARLHQRILRHDPDLRAGAESPVSSTGSRRSERRGGNLPAERSSFVGRHEQVAEVVAMIRRHRLTTLLGAGGAGKTRLALRVAAEAADDFDGVWLVALAALEDPDRLDGHCLTQLQITDQMDRPPGDTLRAWVGERRLLLVLDNCEHLAAATADLADRLLGACPHLHVLATSRQPLRCPGESQWRVPTLSVPHGPDPGAVAASEAGALFLDRASDARPGFRCDEATAPAVAQICRRLDGIPLAIELAAVRMATMSVGDLAAGLDDRFQLLTAGSRTALPRHRTLRATTDWSHSLLTPAQQRLLSRLTVFVADFDVTAAVEVCGAPPLEAREIPGLLADLADQSLVETREIAGHARYHLLETVREYARERLADEAEDVARRYGDWVARLVESVGANAYLDTARWYGFLDREFLHVQGAFAAAMRRGDAETALRIASGSGWALIISGRFHRQREWVREALALARDTDVGNRVMAQGLMIAGAVAGIDQRFDGTLELLAEARERFASAGDAEGTLWAGYWRAATLAEMGDLEEAVAQTSVISGAAADEGRPLVEANTRAEHAELLVARSVATGGPDDAALSAADAALARARVLAESHGMQELLARVSLSEALLAAMRQDPSALQRCLEQVDAWRELGQGNRLILALVVTAKVALWAGDRREARALVSEAIRLTAEFAWAAPLRGALEVVAELTAPHDPETAATLLGAAESNPPTHRWRMPSDVADVGVALERELGQKALAARRAEGAALAFDEALALAAQVMVVGEGFEPSKA